MFRRALRLNDGEVDFAGPSLVLLDIHEVAVKYEDHAGDIEATL